MLIETVKEYETKCGSKAVVCFKLPFANGFVGLVECEYGMSRWWDVDGEDHLDRKYDLILGG